MDTIHVSDPCTIGAFLGCSEWLFGVYALETRQTPATTDRVIKLCSLKPCEISSGLFVHNGSYCAANTLGIPRSSSHDETLDSVGMAHFGRTIYHQRDL